MSFCPVCGVEAQENAEFCTNCGAPLNKAPVMPVSEPVQPVFEAAQDLPVPAKIMSIISMVLGIVSLVSCYAGIFFAIPALILSSISNKKTPLGVPNKMAKTGKITGIFGVIIGSISLIAYIIIVALAAAGEL